MDDYVFAHIARHERRLRPKKGYPAVDPRTLEPIMMQDYLDGDSYTHKEAFYRGFDKQASATSLISNMKKLRSGLSRYSEGGVLKSPPSPPRPGVAIAPKSSMPPIPTMVKQPSRKNLDATLPFRRVKVPKPPNR